jgi:uncharacterized membrane protein
MTKRKTAQRKTLGQRIAPPRFLMFVALLVAVTGLAAARGTIAQAFMTGFDVAAGVFLVSLIPLFKAKSQEQMRQHAAENDANRVMLLAVATVVSLAIMTAVAGELGGKGRPDVILIVTTLVLAWLFANTVYALHYAHIYYLEGSTGGLDFSGEPDTPDYSDFIYFAYTLGMTFQTSDTAVDTRQLRRVVTITDYDSGQPVTHELHLMRSRRVDVYRVACDGVLWRSGVSGPSDHSQ